MNDAQLGPNKRAYATAPAGIAEAAVAAFPGLVERLTRCRRRLAQIGATAHYIGEEVRLARAHRGDDCRFRIRPFALVTTLLTLGSIYSD
jgi:hypothetical protein